MNINQSQSKYKSITASIALWPDGYYMTLALKSIDPKRIPDVDLRAHCRPYGEAEQLNAVLANICTLNAHFGKSALIVTYITRTETQAIDSVASKAVAVFNSILASENTAELQHYAGSELQQPNPEEGG